MKSVYIDFISGLLSSIKEIHLIFNVAVDCANGATSRVINDITFPDNISLNIFNNSPMV